MSRTVFDLQVGDAVSRVLVENLTRTQIVQYAGASGDFNPLHTDEVYATKVAGFPSVFAHGMLTMAMTATAVTDRIGDGRLVRFGVRFKAQVWPGATLTTTLTVDGLRTENGVTYVDLGLSTMDETGVEVLNGYATGVVDR